MAIGYAGKNREKNHMDEIFKKKKIAIFANGWSSEYLELVLEGIRRAAARDSVDIFVFISYLFWDAAGDESKSQLNIFHLPSPKEFDGAIMLTNTFNLEDEKDRVISLFHKKGVPMVSTEVKVPGMAYVGTDNYEGMHELAEHLVFEHNVKRVVYVSGIVGNPECAIRKQTLLDVLDEHGCELVDTYSGEWGFSKAFSETCRWLDEGNILPDVFVCANDHMALGTIHAIHTHGYEVPEDVLVTGFDMVHESKTSYPIIATVSRRWDRMGEMAYEELKNQIEHTDPFVEKVYGSRFVPSESCGCEADRRTINKRLEKSRNIYSEATRKDLIDIFIQNMRTEMSTVDTKEKFYKVASRRFEVEHYYGNNFCICTEPTFFETDDEHYPRRVRGYSDEMDVMYMMENEKSLPQRKFSVRELYPGYVKEDGKSNMYMFAPLNNRGFVIGYVAIKNDGSSVYNMELRKWLSDMDTMFLNIRQYTFAQATNRKLREIYMRDFLTGIYNRTGCETEIFAYVEAKKAAGKKTMLVFADIDCMKIINDEYGHLNGDLAIKATAEALSKSLPKGWLAGRYGGDEFVATGPCKEEDEAPRIREELSESIKKIITDLKVGFTLTVSVGYTIVHPEDEGSIEDFIKRADDYMYEEKEKAHKERGMI